MNFKLMASVLTVALFTVASHSAVDAKPRKRISQQTVIVCNQQGCSDSKSTSKVNIAAEVYQGSVTFLNHPPGCPRSLFCACGAAVDLWGGNGRDYRELWQAAAWGRKFPRSNSPSAGDVAVRDHHVFVLRRHIEGDIWLTADYNSGGRLSRLHAQSIRGYKIVSPSRTNIAKLN